MMERSSSAGKMPDSQSSEPGFESPLLPFRRLGIFVLPIDAPVDSAEYLAVDSGGHVSDLVFAHNCIARMLPGVGINSSE